MFEIANIKGEVSGNEIVVEENPLSRWLCTNTKSAWIWLILRLYLGYTWLTSGEVMVLK
ncbi:hypothetical protein ACFQ3N_12090 [Virgibacillus byunsanensis]|uniref:Uncharacterized protein n=1 Tax=Virgibacillus byunsanensis TaxID=570945 RepID=A0ABW3LLZ4_9BACI